MISDKTLKALEYDKILNSVSEFAVLKKTKENIISCSPQSDINEANLSLALTTEAYKLLFNYSVSQVQYFDDLSDEVKRVDAGGTLNIPEILKVACALKSARLLKTSILSVNDDSIKLIPEIAERIYINQDFEKEVSSKIVSEDRISDNASAKLSSIRKTIRNLNAAIRDKLNSYMRSGSNKYLQESVVTVRNDRYVIPVKSEYRSFIKGFIHDQSSTGATVFIEPEAVMELNNDLRRAVFDEAEEIHRILVDLTSKIANITSALTFNYENIADIDLYFARANYSFKNKCTLPKLNASGVVKINRGRHPLISIDKVVPINISLGNNYNFLLVSGPNTGGKTVAMKIVGLFTLMATSGLYIPADDDSEISVFNGIFCDIGDEQSIEQSLSTFSSHISNVKTILDNADCKSLILLDELGAGTDPDEGSALALAIIKKLLKINCFGVITTHYDALKEFAEENERIENASMQFDSSTLKPLYKLNIGIPGRSNAIDIAGTLGLPSDVLVDALNNVNADKISFENVLKRAEESKRQADDLKAELEILKEKKEQELNIIKEEKEKIAKEREKISFNAKNEIKRIVGEKLEEAEGIIDELKDILKKADLESKDVFKASELKNRLKNSRYLIDNDNEAPILLKKTDRSEMKKGDKVYVKSLSTNAEIVSVKNNKNEVVIRIGNAQAVVKAEDLYNCEHQKKLVPDINVKRSGVNILSTSEINVVGKNALEAVDLVADFIDKAVMSGINEVKIIHGVGAGILLKEIRKYLKGDKNVAEYRGGIYGEGENGVTIVKLK